MVVRTDILSDELTEEQVVIAEYIANQGLATIYRDDLPRGTRMRQPRAAQDIDGFYALVKRAFDDQQEDEGIVSASRFVLTEEYPPVDMETETISYKLLSREPATMGGPPFTGRHEYKPRIRSIVDDPDAPGFKLFTLGQHFENEIMFTCWAKTNKTVNKRALWLEDTLKRYAWMFKYEGVMEFIFLRRLSDDIEELTGKDNTLHSRSLVYYVRTERLTHLSEPTIRRIVCRFGISTIDQ